MISVDLATDLRDAGLRWQPRLHDAFAIPDRDLDGEVFVIAEFTIDVAAPRGQALIRFNGAVEWSLDSILAREVIWLPDEGQLRDALGDAFRSLDRDDAGFRVWVDLGGEPGVFTGATAADAYGAALLHVLRDGGADGAA